MSKVRNNQPDMLEDNDLIYINTYLGYMAGNFEAFVPAQASFQLVVSPICRNLSEAPRSISPA